MPLYEYFYPDNSDQYSFYRIPKRLFRNEALRGMSSEAKILYGLLLDRVSLSVKNGWVDQNNRVYIIYTRQEITEMMEIAPKTATRLMAELEEYGLIERRRQGLGRPSILYVKNFAAGRADITPEKGNNDPAGGVNPAPLEGQGLPAINTDRSHTENSDIHLILSPDGCDGLNLRSAYESFIKEQVGYDELLQEYPYRKDELDGLVMLMVDVSCSNARTIRIAGDDKPINVVKSQMMKIGIDDLRYVLNSMHENTTEIKNIRAYMLTSLFYAPITIGAHSQMQVMHDAVSETANGRQEGGTWPYGY